MKPAGETPGWAHKLLKEAAIEGRMSDQELRRRGVDPNRVRRWFKNTHGLTFQGYLRLMRLGK
ncbi:MAG: XRE family transcriptional regulator, partial [Candidatus Margulisiibacteriota bacterium]